MGTRITSRSCRSSSLATAVLLAALATSLAGISTASAQKKTDAQGDDVVGSYDVRYEEVSTNCSTTSIALTRGTVDITKKKTQLVVDIQRFPLMYGVPSKGGKVRASSKVGKSSIDGVD